MAKIFLSHAKFDSDLAIYLKTVLEENLRGIEIFCSSDPTDLPPGTKWPKEIQNALENADMLLLLATSRSLSRPWVWFECGTFWFGDKKIIPLCIGQVQKNTLPSPFSELMAVDLDDTSDVDNLFRFIEGQTSTTREQLDIANIVKSLYEIDKTLEERTLVESAGWIGITWEDKFLSYDGPIEGLKLIEDRPFQQAISDALTTAGFKVYLAVQNKLSGHAEKGYRVVYLTDRKSWRQKITRNEQVLMARPITSEGEERIQRFIDKFLDRYKDTGHILEVLIPGGINNLKDDEEIKEALEKLIDFIPELSQHPLRGWKDEVEKIGYKKFFSYVAKSGKKLNKDSIEDFIKLLKDP